MSAFQALRHRDFRLYFSGQTVSMVGTWMQNLAMGWMVYRLTGQPKWLGIVAFSAQGMAFVFSPLGGILSDRFRVRNMVIVVQVLALLQAIGMAVLAWHPGARVWQVLVLSLILGAVSAFDMTGRQVLVTRTVPQEDLPGAIALHSATFHGSRILGPALAGLVLAKLGEGWCFLFNALSYFAALAALLLMRSGNEDPVPGKGGSQGKLSEAARYVWGDKQIRLLLIFLGLIVFLGMPYTALMPMFAATLLKAGPDALGWILGAGGVGATLGALSLARRKGAPGLERVIVIAGFAFPVALTAFAFSRTLWLSALLMGFVSLFLVTMNTGNSTLVQLSIPGQLRGRIMAIYGMVFIGAMPLGALWGGFAAQHIGATWTLSIGAIGCILTTIFFAIAMQRLPPPVSVMEAVSGQS
jgi:MFS family permease